jgi:hypothetical protein
MSVQYSYAGYDANLNGEVSHVMTYSSGLILFRLKNQPSAHPQCNKAYFAIATDVSEAAASRLYARLLTAHTTKTSVNIGYDSLGSCANGYIRVHRIG